MNFTRLEVSRHGCPHFIQSRYWFYPESGRLVPQRQDDQPAELPAYGSTERSLNFRGSFKRFFVGGAVVLFRDDDIYFIQIGTNQWRLGSPCLHLERRVIGPFGVLTVRSEDYQKNFVEFRLFAQMQKSIDVAYDSLDESLDDFSGEILQLHKKQAEQFNNCRV